MHIKLNPLDMLNYRIVETLRDSGQIDEAEFWARAWLDRDHICNVDLAGRYSALAALGVEV